ncbi:Uncharacterised protein [Staphylococcus aureus]|nr:Uncharacterised protein [Staphylococcus aureus]CAC6797801.1 Uncharacterised protein [Staphylococcus aureus]CAC6828643.1 Uncharacterised protein [Staphylococcus aureus]CAC8437004.1 Uncharacterised protein [Staphylococcus aureus]CXU95003.1 Uncharacterised protein [Staphylococcus aureus]
MAENNQNSLVTKIATYGVLLQLRRLSFYL